MPCREAELLDMLRRVLADGVHSTDTEAAARRLLDEIDEEVEALRNMRDPFGDNYGRV